VKNVELVGWREFVIEIYTRIAFIQHLKNRFRFWRWTGAKYYHTGKLHKQPASFVEYKFMICNQNSGS